jgi:outer membrane immunogenic protein
MNKILFATSALLVASATPVLAQDAPAPADTGASTAAAPMDGNSFAGPRAEIFGGWDRVGTRTRFDNGTVRDTAKSHKDGGTAGALLGYDMPVGDKMIAGVFGSYALSTNKECGAIGGLNGCIKAGREIEGGARVGYKLNPNSLVYLKGAYVNGRVRATFSDGVDYVSGHDNRDGWRAGAGVQYAVSNHAYVKAEYDYTRFKSYRPDDLGIADTSLRFDRNQVLAGFGVNF